MIGEDQPGDAPTQIQIDQAAGMLEVSWHDGSGGHISHQRLRACCACADCKAQMLNGRFSAPPAEIRIIEALPVGSYAVQFRFSDGHERGIYPWRYLRELVAIEP